MKVFSEIFLHIFICLLENNHLSKFCDYNKLTQKFKLSDKILIRRIGIWIITARSHTLSLLNFACCFCHIQKDFARVLFTLFYTVKVKYIILSIFWRERERVYFGSSSYSTHFTSAMYICYQKHCHSYLVLCTCLLICGSYLITSLINY